jgi:hypothetical protein
MSAKSKLPSSVAPAEGESTDVGTPAAGVEQPRGNAAAIEEMKAGGAAKADDGEFGTEFDFGKALQETIDSSSPEGKQRIAQAQIQFQSAKTLAITKFGLMAQNQASGMDALQQAAQKKKPPTLAQTVVSQAVSGAIGAATGGLGGVIATAIAGDLKETVGGAFKTAGAAAGTVASEAVAKQWTPDADGAFAYFQSLKESFPIMAGQIGSAFSARADADWKSAAGSVTAAERLAKAMEDTAAALQAQLNAGSGSAKISAVDGWLCTLAQSTLNGGAPGPTNMADAEPGLVSDPKGVLMLDIMVGDAKGKAKPTITSARIEGVPKELLDAAKIATADGRNLSQMNIPKHITAHKSVNYKETTQAFQFGANEAGTIWHGMDNWLVVHGGGDIEKPSMDMAFQGAKKLLNDEMATLTLGGLLK